MHRLYVPFVLAFTVGALLGACGQPAKCGSSNCAGCCDSSGVCQLGQSSAACGSAGVACGACDANQSCVSNTCIAATGGGAGGGTGGGAGGGGGSGTCTRTAVACSDAAIAQLALKIPAAPGSITNAADGTGWLSTVDATAGGFNPTQAFVYAKFTATGLEKVSLGDEAALDSMDWDIAFRRFYIRLNGGDSGPACTAAASTTAGTTYASVTAEPAGLTYSPDNFLSDAPTCAFIDDGSGLTTSPNTALASFYTYTSCVTMSGKTFIVKTSAGRVLKLTVTTYYATEAQQTACNDTGTPGTGGTIRVRWQFLN